MEDKEVRQEADDRTDRTRDQVRLGFASTSGGEVHVDDAEVATVTGVTTHKHGPCLVLRLRDGEKLWVLDTEQARRRLRMPEIPISLRRGGG